ncbi:MAG: selenocysteine-specific translation elongation factor [Alphaproteobacteria bacterium]|nr:selenocysteine-specific translation elongation factor [Alphaproteobacteria bacterium]
MIIATAGHIDHGKTTLVTALTGVDTDRLPEEKTRGMTIDLGFAYRPLDEGPVMGFIDVPGHERFVRNMLAGVAGIDFALLVVAADDGPMAQTREHLAILNLLGITQGAVALTKADLADANRLAALEAEIAALIAPTGLKDAPIFRTSGATGDGIEALGAHLEAAARAHEARSAAGNFRLAIDRCFSVAGAGLVVTGTAFAGHTEIDDRLVVSPTGTHVRVRSIHAQNRNAETGAAGQRLGVNITGSGLNRAGVHRGDWLVAEAVHAPTRRLDARIRLLASEPRALRHWARVHVHLGSAEVTGRVALLADKAIEPGTGALVQLVLDDDICALGGDRLILRDASAQRTIGGGRVIDPFAPTRGRARPERLAVLVAMEEADPAVGLAALLDLSPLGVEEEKFRIARNIIPPEMTRLVEAIRAVRFGAPGGGVIFAPASWEALKQSILGTLAEVHREAPETAGLAEQSLRKRSCPRLLPGVFQAILQHLAEEGAVARVGAHLALPDHRARMSEEDEALWVRIADILEADPFRPPVVHAIAEELRRPPRDVERFMGRAERMGYLYRTARNRFFLRAPMIELARIAEAVAANAQDGRLAIPAFRGATEIGRNLAVEVLEFFDKAGLTARDGDARRMRANAARIFPES